METPVNKLEAMFQKAESDLGYLEKQLKFEFMTKMAESGAAEDNPVKLLEKLSAVKARHKALCAQMEEITKQQQQSMEAIRAHLSTTVQLVEQLQKSADVEVQPPREAEQAAAQALLGDTVEIPAASGASAAVSGLRGQLGKRNSGNPDALE